MATPIPHHEPLYGLLELDAAGTIIYYTPDERADGAAHVVGRNFFTDIAPMANGAEFRELLNSFRLSHEPARRFDFTFQLGQASCRAHVLLARIREQSELGSAESVLVNIKRA